MMNMIPHSLRVSLVFACFLVSITSLHAEASPTPVIFDTDIGSDIDDTWALAYLLNCPELDPKLILTATGNTTYRARLAAKFLEVSERTDIPVGIGKHEGSFNEFQAPWVGDYRLEDYPGTIHEDGIDALIQIVKDSKTPVAVIAVGALPNIQEALRRDPSIAQNIHFYGMHGSIDQGYGGGAPAAEANVVSNVEAFRTVLQADWKHAEITPLDTCGHVVLEGENYQKLKASESPMLQALFENYRVWADLVTWMEVDSPQPCSIPWRFTWRSERTCWSSTV